MSLEVALQENTKAVLALAALFAAGKLPVASAEAPAAPVTPKPELKAEPKAEPKTDAPAAGALNYDADIKPLALALAKKDRTKLVAVWKELGVNVGTELKPEQFAKAKELIVKASA